jgi:endo-1,4-beta-xylanase
MKKRILAILLALSLIAAFIPASVGANTTTQETLFVGFECGTLNGYELRGPLGEAKLTVTNEEARSGRYSLLVSERKHNWNGAQLQIGNFIKTDIIYEVSYWILLKTPEPVLFTTFINLYPINRINLWRDHITVLDGFRMVAREDGWTKITGYLLFDESVHCLEDILFIIEPLDINPSAEYYIDDVSFRVHELNQNIKDSARLPSLAEAYKNYFKIGVTEEWFPFNINPVTTPFYTHHFNVMTQQFTSYTHWIAPERGVLDFSEPDRSINAQWNAGMDITGHAIIYRVWLPQWMYQNPDGSYITRAESIQIMEEYVNTMIGRYKDRVGAWHVTNETIGNLANGAYFFTDEYWGASGWYMAFDNGADKSKGESGGCHVEYAFRFARAADPNAKLWLNETAEIFPAVADAIYEMVKGINERWLAEGNDRLLIEGIGMQGHYDLNVPIEAVERSIKLFASLGVEVAITELDIAMFNDMFDYEFGVVGTATQALFEKQAEYYARLFQLFKKYSDVITSVEFMGIIDDTSWLNGSSTHGFMHPQYPVLFNGDFTPKLAYFAVIDPEGYLAGNFRTAAQRQAWIRANSLPISDELTLNRNLFGIWDSLGTVQSLSNYTQRNQHNVNTWMQDIMRRRGDNRQQLIFTGRGRIVENGVTGFGDTWSDASIGGRSYEIRTIGGNDYLFIDNRTPGSRANASWTVFVRR